MSKKSTCCPHCSSDDTVPNQINKKFIYCNSCSTTSPKTSRKTLKDCPICGSSEVSATDKTPDNWVNCLKCDTEAPFKVWQSNRYATGEGVDNVIAFDNGIRNLIAQHMKSGLTVTEVVGTLACIQAEVLNSFFTMNQGGE